MELICNLILGELPQGEKRPWLYEIVSNPRNGIDVDKFDYLKRDTQKLNVAMSSFNERVIMDDAMVVGGHICYAEKNDIEIKKLFDTRYMMYDSLYHHRVT